MPEFSALIGHRKPAKRQTAVEQLGQLGDSVAATYLGTLLWDESQQVRLSAALALTRLNPDIALGGLLKVLNDREKASKAGAAFGEIGVPALELLLIALRNPNGRIRGAAASGLVKVGSPAVIPLIEIASDSKRFGQDYAASALGQIGDLTAVEPLIGQLEKADKLALFFIISALGRLRDSRAVKPLIQLLDRPHHWLNGSYAIMALQSIGTPEALAAVEKSRNKRDV
jgi:HEAT repeat protein